jgi:iron complex outermembrane recepter protein
MAFKTVLRTGVAGIVIGTCLSTGYTGLAQETETDEARLGTVTVTAQRVEEDLQDVPVAVTALDSEQIERRQVTDILDLTAQVPNINIAANTGTANAARIFLRGVGEDESRGAVDQAVGIYVDGVYIGRSVGSLFDVVDLESIEVLRGPQGTLYGRNTIGGAIKLTSVKPQFENSGDVRLVIGNEGRLDIRGTGNLQLADTLAVRGTILSRERDGFHRVVPNGELAGQGIDLGEQDILSGRISIYGEMDNGWSLFAAYDQTDDSSDPIPGSVTPGFDGDNDLFTIDPLPGLTCTVGSTRPGCFTGYDQETDTKGLSINVNGQLFGLDFSSITGYRELEDSLTSPIGDAFYQQATVQDQFSQEFTLAYTDERMDLLGGVYFFTEELVLDTTFVVFPTQVDTETESVAIFGQGTVNLTDALSVTGGVRYTDESKDFEGINFLIPAFARTDSADFENTSFTVGVDYAITEDILGYAKYSTGFKSGGWSPDAFSPTAIFLPVDEETLDSIEAGVKADLFDNRVRINSAVFFNQYEGLQIGATVPGVGFTRFNVDETEIMGLEVDAIWQVTPNFQLNGNLGLLDAEYTELTGDQARGLSNNGAGCPAGTDASDDAQAIDCALGLDLKNAPEYKINIGGLYTQQLGSGEIVASADVSYEDESFSLVANAPPNALISFDAIVNARLVYEADAGWSVGVFGRNLTDEEYYRAATAGDFIAYAADPATYGLELGYRF